MNETEYLLTVLSEECAEVAQRACKAARFGLREIQPGQPEDNTRRLERELADLMAVAKLLGLRVREKDKAAKRKKLKKFMDYSRKIGALVADVPTVNKCPACDGRGSIDIGKPYGVVPCAICSGKKKKV